MTIARVCIAVVISSALLLTACPGPTFIVQQYAGPVRPQSSIATLRVNGGDSVRLLALDEEDVAAPIDSDARLHIELLPARHTLIVGNANTPRARLAPLTFQAEAGKFYRVAFVPATATEPAEAAVYEVDRGSDKLVRRVADTAPKPERLDGPPGEPREPREPREREPGEEKPTSPATTPEPPKTPEDGS